ncbi:MAG: S9 family peptidase [Chloroflexi bacterium]|nr:S9 family peptidase [Chloroflexota bacterium]
MSWENNTPLIPRSVLFGNPDKTQARLSPDGSQLSYLAPVDGVLNVWVGPVADPAAAKPVTTDTGRGIRFHGWAYTNQQIIYLQDRGGDENWRIYSVDLATHSTTDLTPIEGVQARIEKVSPESPTEILISLNDRDPQFHDLYTVNLQTAERRLVLENTGFAGFVMDDAYTVHLAIRMTADGGSEWLTRAADDGWTVFQQITMEDTGTTSPIGLDKTGNLLYLADSRGRDTAALVALNLQSGEKQLLSADTQADVGTPLIHPTQKHIQAVSYTYTRARWEVLDETIAADLAYLRTVANGELGVADRTVDDQQWIVAYTLDNGPVRYYRYDRSQRQATFLFTNRAALEDLPLAKMHPVVIPARDHLNLVSYYTLPVGSERPGQGEARPVEPLAMVLLVHGGPWGRDAWGLNSLHQWLANRGYAVLSVNFRASTGFGKAFANAGNLAWGAQMHDDLIDAVNWAVAAGIADPARVAIMGGSYGGYATLAGLTFTPETFACGVDIVGPSNLVTLIETIPAYWKPIRQMLTARVGDPSTEAGRAFLTSRSPLTYADRIQRPLLIGQGANDPRVKQAESDQIVQAMQAKNIPVTYVLYPDEGHGFARPANNLSFFAITEAFLAQHLEERYESIGQDFANASLTVPTGKEQIPGLAAALT